MELNALALNMKLKGILIDQEKRKEHEERLGRAASDARERFARAVSEHPELEGLATPEAGDEDGGGEGGSELSSEEAEAGKWISRLEKLKPLFFERFGIQPTHFSESTGKPSLNETALKAIVALSSAPPGAIAAARALLSYREAHKTLSTYVQRLNPLHEKSYLFGSNSVLHPTWNVLQAKTGRWSCSDPNLQNIQKSEYNKDKSVKRAGMRDMFVARPGTVLVEGDYKQLEVRVIAVVTGDDPLIAGFAKGLDVYRLAAADIFHIAPAEVSPGQRQMAKIAVLAMNYGGGVAVIHQQLVLSFPAVTHKAVEFMYDRWKNAHPAIFGFQRRMFQHAKEHGYVACPISGRRLQFYLDRVVPTEAANFPIQGTAGDIINPVSVKVGRGLLPDEHLLMQIHDALYLEVPEGRVESAVSRLRAAMETTHTFPNGKSMTFPVDIKVGTDWGNMKEFK